MSAGELVQGIEDGLHLYQEPGAVHEVRIPQAGRGLGTISGYFDDPAKAATEIAKVDGEVPGVYVTLNPVSPDLLARANNRLTGNARSTTKDDEVVDRRRLLIDIDPVRPSGVSSTDGELWYARNKANELGGFLKAFPRRSIMFTLGSGKSRHCPRRLGYLEEARNCAGGQPEDSNGSLTISSPLSCRPLCGRSSSAEFEYL